MLLVVILGLEVIALYFLVWAAYRKGFYEGSVAACDVLGEEEDPNTPLHVRINARRKW